jgi:hypothetical protein
MFERIAFVVVLVSWMGLMAFIGARLELAAEVCGGVMAVSALALLCKWILAEL